MALAHKFVHENPDVYLLCVHPYLNYFILNLQRINGTQKMKNLLLELNFQGNSVSFLQRKKELFAEILVPTLKKIMLQLSVPCLPIID